MRRQLALVISALACASPFTSDASAQPPAATSPSPVGLPVPHKDPRDFRVSVLGCLRQNRPAPSLARYAEHGANLVLWVGDNIYADAKDDPGIIQRCYDQLAANADFQRIRAAAPAMATWDDHDYGNNNEDKSYKLKHASREMFVRFWGLVKELPINQSGIR